jgi:hypothetical protein
MQAAAREARYLQRHLFELWLAFFRGLDGNTLGSLWPFDGWHSHCA